MRNLLLPRIVFSAFLALCAAAPLLLSGCGDDDSISQDLSVRDQAVAHDLSGDQAQHINTDGGSHD